MNGAVNGSPNAFCNAGESTEPTSRKAVTSSGERWKPSRCAKSMAALRIVSTSDWFPMPPNTRRS